MPERHFKTELPPEMLEPEPRARIEEFLTSRESIKYTPGSVYMSPDGKEYKVSAVDFINKGFMLEDKKTREFKFFAGSELKGFKRRLGESDYAGETYWHLNEGWAGKVLFCVPEKDILKIERQDREVVDVSFDEFVEKFRDIPDDLYAPFKDSYVRDKRTKKAVYVEDVNFERQSMVLQRCKIVIDVETGRSTWRPMAESSHEIPIAEFKKRFKEYVESVRDVWGDL